MKKFIAALVIAAAGLTALSASGSALARGQGHRSHECKASVRAAGSPNLLRRLARQNAVKAWSREAETAAGPDYAKWEKARRKSVSCKAQGRMTVRCAARGAPCR